MEEQDTIRILVSQLLCKDDEICSLRSQLSRLQEEQQSGNALIMEKLDRSFCELKSICRDNKKLATQLSKVLSDKSDAENKSALLSNALEELKNLRASELYELEKQKRQLYGRKSEEIDLKKDKDDFDGSAPCGDASGSSSAATENEMPDRSLTSSVSSCRTRPIRSDYSKRSTSVENVVMHYCDEDDIPSDARKIDVRHWLLYKLDWSVTKHVFELLRMIDPQGDISNYYEPADKEDDLRPFENALPGYHVDLDMIAQILVDKYQYSMPLDRIVERFKDVDASFSSSTVLNWAHRHIEELGKLDSSLRALLLSEGSFLFCDETTEQVKVMNPSTGKMEYRKKYIWGIKNPGLKVTYYLYDNGSRNGKVAERFFTGFTGSVTTDGYNVYKMFERKDSTITRYACMAHVRRKFVEALQSDSRSAGIVNLISELYWIESDCRIRFLSEDERVDERRRRSIPILGEIWQKIKPLFDETRDHASTLFLKAVRYAVNEWEAVCRYIRNGGAEIDNNAAERMMKPICSVVRRKLLKIPL